VLPEKPRYDFRFGCYEIFGPVPVALMHQFVDQYLQSATAFDAWVNLDLAVRPPQPLGLMPTQLALYDHWQFGLAHLMMR
jgi:hypothetical protein